MTLSALAIGIFYPCQFLVESKTGCNGGDTEAESELKGSEKVTGQRCLERNKNMSWLQTVVSSVWEASC